MEHGAWSEVKRLQSYKEEEAAAANRGYNEKRRPVAREILHEKIF
jgi:hypothetical protein